MNSFGLKNVMANFLVITLGKGTKITMTTPHIAILCWEKINNGKSIAHIVSVRKIFY